MCVRKETWITIIDTTIKVLSIIEKIVGLIAHFFFLFLSFLGDYSRFQFYLT